MTDGSSECVVLVGGLKHLVVGVFSSNGEKTVGGTTQEVDELLRFVFFFSSIVYFSTG